MNGLDRIRQWHRAIIRGTTMLVMFAGQAPSLSAQMKLDPGNVPPNAPGEAPPDIKDIAPPIDVSPYPPWMVALAIALLLLILGLVAWMVLRKLRNRPPPIPPTAHAIALHDLEKLRDEVERLAPYAFSIAVSDILRRFVSAHFGLKATQQTSPEFLGSLSGVTDISAEGRSLLTRFLEQCDMIKFARIAATTAVSRELLTSAIHFVKGAGR